MAGYGERIGQAWAQSNAEFDASKPSGLRRALRYLGPEAIGSVAGDMYTAVGQGDRVGVGLAAASALPLLGTYMKGTYGMVPNLRKMFRDATGDVMRNGVNDAYTNYR